MAAKSTNNGERWGATRDPDEVRRDWERWPDANIGCPTDADNGFWVLDCDTAAGHKNLKPGADGIASLAKLVAEHGPLPVTVQSESPSGSMHYYFKHPEGDPVRCSASKVAPGIDVKGEGGMVLLPPSVWKGGVYRWINDPDKVEIAAAPEWLLRLVQGAKDDGHDRDSGDAPDWITAEDAGQGIEVEPSLAEVEAAVAAIPNDDLGWDDWCSVGLAIYAACGGAWVGLDIFDRWSRKSEAKYDEKRTFKKWQEIRGCPPDRTGFGKLEKLADEADPGWRARITAAPGSGQTKPKNEYKAPTPAPIRSWAGREVPAPEFTVEDRIPAEQVFLFSGEGGGGKSSIVEHLCAAHTLGRQWQGCNLRQGPAIYLECEDSEKALWWRLAAIAAHYGAPIETFADSGLQLYSLVEHDTILAATNKRGIVQPTQFYQWLYELAGDIKPVQIAIASVANVFAGSEINRTEVQQFIKLLARIPAVTKGSLTLVSQPSLTGLSSTNVSHEGLSGTTQWHNAVRGRAGVKIVKPKEGEGNGIDTGLRTLTFYKNQYGPPVAGAVLRWQNGLYLPIAGTVLSGGERAAAAESLAIILLQRFAAQNRSVSINVNGINYAPSQFEQTQEAEAAGLTRKDFKQAIERLLSRGEIENAENKGGKGRHKGQYHLKVKQEETK
jgi:RecA-family ATPase